MKKWLRPHLWFEKYWWLIESSQKQAQKLLTEKLDKLSLSNKVLIQDYVDLLNMPKEKRRQTLNQYKLRKNKSFHTKIFRTLILTKFAYKGKNK